MMKALEVLINGKVVGLYIPPEGECFGVMLGNVPRTYMRAQVVSGNKTESWYWQLPDIKEGEIISFRLIEADGKAGVPPQERVPKDAKNVKKLKKLAASSWAQAKKEMKKKKKTKVLTRQFTAHTKKKRR